MGAVSIVVASTGPEPVRLDRVARLRLDGVGHEIVVVAAQPPAPVVSSLPVRYVRVPAGQAVHAARNQGATVAHGEHLAFLDPAVTPDAQWVHRALERFRADARVVAVAARVDGPDGRCRFAGADLDASGRVVERFDDPALRPVLFASPAASMVEARAFGWVGGYDPVGCPGIEDVDLGWRLWQAGFEVWCDPASFVVAGLDGDVLGGASAAGAARLTMMAKNTDEPWRALLVEFDRRLTGSTGAVATTSAAALARADRARPAVSARRRVRDRALWARFGPALRQPTDPAMQAALAASGLGAALDRPPHVLVITPDVLAPAMAGPAIRAMELGRALAGIATVEVVSTVRCDLDDPVLRTAHLTGDGLRAAVERSDVVVVQGNVLDVEPWLEATDRPIVVDLYDPIHLEVLEQSRELPLAHRRRTVGFVRDTLARQIARGDFFLTASEKQRDLWIGHLAFAGRVNATSYDRDPSLRRMIDVVPFGIPAQPPLPTAPALRGVVPGIGADDLVVLWAGGVYNWFDPITLIHAVDRVRDRLPKLRLVFMGMAHPHPEVPEMAMAREARDLANRLGLVGEHVFFNEGWVPYDQRQNFLLEADLGVSTHLDHVETAYSFRTRILDYLWAALPIVATDGDGMARLIADGGLGRVVPPGDVEALMEALVDLGGDGALRAACRDRIRGVRDAFVWDRAAAPLVRFGADPQRAVDLVDPRETGLRGDREAAAVWGSGWTQSARAVLGHVRRGEWSEVRRKADRRLGRADPPAH